MTERERRAKAADRVRKLLRLARDRAATPGEKAAALSRARRLISKHSLLASEYAEAPDRPRRPVVPPTPAWFPTTATRTGNVNPSGGIRTGTTDTNVWIRFG